jgi:hypothetical protein
MTGGYGGRTMATGLFWPTWKLTPLKLPPPVRPTDVSRRAASQPSKDRALQE